MDRRKDDKQPMETRKDSNLENQLDSDVNTKGFTRPYGESQTIQEDPDQDPNQSDKPGFKRNKDA